MCRAFRHFSVENKRIVHRYHLKETKSNVLNLKKPQVVYCSWSWKADGAMQEEEQEQEQEQEQDVDQKGEFIDE